MWRKRTNKQKCGLTDPRNNSIKQVKTCRFCIFTIEDTKEDKLILSINHAVNRISQSKLAIQILVYKYEITLLNWTHIWQHTDAKFNGKTNAVCLKILKSYIFLFFLYHLIKTQTEGRNWQTILLHSAHSKLVHSLVQCSPNTFRDCKSSLKIKFINILNEK